MSLGLLGVTGTESSEPLDLSRLSPAIWLKAAAGRTAKGASQTTKTNVEYWKNDSAGALEPAMGTGYTTSILIKPNTGGSAGAGTLVDLRDTAENKGLILYVRADNGYVVFAMQGNKVTPGAIQQIFTGGSWGLYAGKYDPAAASGAGSLLVSKNGGAFGNGINTITQQNPTSPKFGVGAFRGAEASGNCLDADVAQVCVWHKAVSDAEISALWNGGAGLKYEDFTAGLLTNLVECFEFNGVDGAFVGRVAGVTLTPVNGVAFADGLHDTTARDYSVIRQMADQSGNGRNCSQTTASERPYLRVSPDRLVFAGGQRLATPAFDLGSQFSLYAVGKVDAVGTLQSLAGHIDVGNHLRLSVAASGDVEAVVYGGGGPQTVTVTPGSAMTNLAVLGLRCDGTNVSVSHNNSKASGTISGGFSTSSSRVLYIGSHASSGGNPLTGEIREWLWVPSSLSDGMHNVVVASLAETHGITL